MQGNETGSHEVDNLNVDIRSAGDGQIQKVQVDKLLHEQ
jgi:hypothetical protein